MQQPFDISLGNIDYAVFPEGNDVYVIFKDGKEYVSIQKDTDLQWIKLDAETGIFTVFGFAENLHSIPP